MRIHLIAVGSRMPRWVDEGFTDYAKRMPAECRVNLVEIPTGRRGKHADLARLRRDEGTRQLAAIPRGAHVVALEVTGRSWSTGQLAGRLDGWLREGRDTALLIGGPEGLDPTARAAAAEEWSLSALTLPHPLVRVLIAEQLYRAWSILQHHPYHRG
jgi:23S rRNA (pseudouridine1915-N3)-methyltransferase